MSPENTLGIQTVESGSTLYGLLIKEIQIKMKYILKIIFKRLFCYAYSEIGILDIHCHSGKSSIPFHLFSL